MTDPRRPLGPDDVEALLRRAPRPEPPSDMVAKVRARLAAERATLEAPPAVSETPGAPLAMTAPVASLEERAPSPGRRWAVEGLVVAAAAAALVVAVGLGRGLPRGANPVAEAAGIAGDSAPVVDVHLRASVLDEDRVRRMAEEAGLSLGEREGRAVYEGGPTDVRRFLVQLRVEAARAGGEVRGFVPDAGRLRVTVTTE